MFYLIIKNIFDRLFAFLILILLFPIILIISALNLLFLGLPIFFTQIRPGLNKKPFKLYKFRTMKNIPYGDPNFQQDKKRLTKYGNLLRKTSIDEIPSLVNILQGDLSFVGPRPLLMEYLNIYNQIHAKRHDIKPGLTGWAAVNGRNSNTWKVKLDQDIWYLENRSFFLDVKILLLTIYKVFKREGINTKQGGLMPKLLKNYDK